VNRWLRTRSLAWRGAVIAACCASAGLLAQSRETLETKVTAVGDTVTLKWGQKHPWDAELKARGASLFVEYRSARGTGLDCGASAQAGARGARTAPCQGIPATVDADDRTATFTLPQTLTAVPLGPICLYLRMADQRPLPIRRAGKDTANTSRFQFAEWSQRVIVTAQRTTVEDERARLQATVAQQSKAIDEQLRFNKGKGWASPTACETLQPGTLQITQDRPVAAPAEQDEIARTVCVMRLVRARALQDVQAPDIVQPKGVARTLDEAKLLLALVSGHAQPAPVLTALLGFVDEPKRQEWLRVRGGQARQFVDDWNRLESRISDYQRRYPTPHFESFSTVLNLQSLTYDAAIRMVGDIRNGRKPDPQDAMGFAGGSLEAYGRCVNDGKRQLTLNYEQSKSLQANSGNLQARLTQQARQECRQGIEKVDSMQRRLAELNTELAATAQRATQTQAPAASRKTFELNDASCTP
jgi:hypothetical protein